MLGEIRNARNQQLWRYHQLGFLKLIGDVNEALVLNKNSNREKVQEAPAEVRYHATEAECIQLKVQLREIALTLSTLRCKRCLGDPQVQTLFGRRVDFSAISLVPQHIHPRYKIVNPTYPPINIYNLPIVIYPHKLSTFSLIHLRVVCLSIDLS